MFAGRAGFPFSRPQPNNSTQQVGARGVIFVGSAGVVPVMFFSSDLLRISVVPHKFVWDIREAVGARDVIFGRPWGPGWATVRNPDVLSISAVPHKFV